MSAPGNEGRIWPAFGENVIMVILVTTEELKEAIEQTKEKIWEIRRQVESASDPAERRAFKRQLKELQYL